MSEAQIKTWGSGGMVFYTIEGATEAEVQEAIAGIERSYHPMGYGTSFRPIEKVGDDRFLTSGHRANSCD